PSGGFRSLAVKIARYPVRGSLLYPVRASLVYSPSDLPLGAEGLSSRTSTSNSSTCRSGWSHSCPWDAASVSEWAPHPWSRETTLPSSGDHWLAQTPNKFPSDPASGITNPQVAQGAPAALAPGVSGPRDPAYQRGGAASMEARIITRSRRGSSTNRE